MLGTRLNVRVTEIGNQAIWWKDIYANILLQNKITNFLKNRLLFTFLKVLIETWD